MFTKFLDKLEHRSSRSGVFNPYRDKNLRHNLQSYLEYLYDNKHNEVLLVGEALGFSGGKFTGVPFTSGELFSHSQLDIFKQLKSKVFLEKIESEKTASIVWECVGNREKLPIFWNAFPFHPYQKRKLMSNRAPTQKEISEGRFYIQELIRIFEPTTIASIGRKGEMALKQIYPNRDIDYIRHPSYGGKADFIKGMKALL